MSEQTVTVPIIDDIFFEFKERFFGDLTLVSTDAAVTLSPERATVLIDVVFLSGICVCKLMHFQRERNKVSFSDFHFHI